MPDATPTVDNLMKVSVDIWTGTTSPDEAAGTPFTFIYGIGSAGITPFEKALFRKEIGDRIEFDLLATDYCETIGHLQAPLHDQTGIVAPGSMQVTITDVVRAPDRDVVSAMAASGSCGDCGCGCGGH